MLVGVITADPLGVLVAFGAGILSFLSPCVLPLVPGYLSMVSGLSAAELGEGMRPRARTVTEEPERSGALVGAASHLGTSFGTTAVATLPGRVGAFARPASPAAGTVRRPLAPLLRGILLFIAGFTVVFVAQGAIATSLSHALSSHKAALTAVSGAVVVVLGIVMLASSLPAGVWMRVGSRVSGRVAWLVGERRMHLRPGTLGAWAAPVMGMAFAFAWVPCTGPVLAAMDVLAARTSTLAGGMLLLVAYSLGLGVPFLATGLAFDRLTGFYVRARRPLALVQVAAGAVLVAFGALLLAGDLGWISAQFSSLLDHLGLQRLTTS